MPRRLRRRYVAVKVESNGEVKKEDLFYAIWNNVLRLFGEYGASQTDLRLIEYSPEDNLAVIRCSHKSLPMVKASITCVTRIGRESAALHIQLVSGTLKSLRRKLSERIKKG